MSRRTSEALEANASKRPKIAHDINVIEVMADLQELRTIVGQFKWQGVNVELDCAFDMLRDIIVHIVVAGAQSAGKSTLLNRLFPGIELPTNTGVCTMCPIEIRVGPKYSQALYVLHNGLRKEMPDMTAAAEYVKQVMGDILTLDPIIVCEKFHDRDLVITDLPGVNNDPRGEAFYAKMRNDYFCRQRTVLFYVTRGDVDPSNDITRKYLDGLAVVPVLTNSDAWLSDRAKMGYLRHHEAATPSGVLAIVNNKMDADGRDLELDTLARIAPKSALNKTLLLGRVELENHLYQLLERETRKNIPDIQKAITSVRNAFNSEFSRIGRVAPDMRELRGELRSELNNRVRDAFRSGTTYAVATNSVRRQLNTGALLTVATSLIPSDAQIAVDLEQGSRSALPGSEGWNDVVVNANKKILDKIHDELLKMHLVTHVSCVQSEVEKLFDVTYRPATEEIQKTLRAHVGDIVAEHAVALNENIMVMIAEIANCPYSADKLYTQNWAYASIEIPVMATIAYFAQMGRKAEAVEAAVNGGTKQVMDHVMRSMPDSMYKINATLAFRHLKCFWESKCVEMETRIREKLMFFEKQVEKSVESMVLDIGYDGFSESVDVAMRRASLVSISDACDKIAAKL